MRKIGRRPGRRGKWIFRISLVSIGLAAVAAGAVFLPNILREAQDRRDNIPSVESVLASWAEKNYELVLTLCAQGLEYRPLDPFYLVLKGFASFYSGVGETDGEARLRFMDDAVFSLRKAMTSPSVPFHPQVLYVLGKAYYHKGPFYMDEAVRYLESSIAAGYYAEDTQEYIALAYSDLGYHSKSVVAFERALANGKTDLLLLAAARGYIQSGLPEKAEITALEALSLTEDALVREHARFLLGELYSARKDYKQAEEQYNLILEMNPQSADAHFRLGLIWQERGDPVRARAEWRKAVSLDPMHTAARQKLAERI